MQTPFPKGSSASFGAGSGFGEEEHRAGARIFGRGPELAVVRGHDAAGDGQREAHATAELLERRELLGWDLAEIVDPVGPADGDAERRAAILCGALHTDAELIARHELPAVGDQQRVQRATQLDRISVDAARPAPRSGP